MSHTSQSDISLAQMACLEVGAQPIASFEDETTEAKILNAHYDTIVNNELSQHPWRFSMAQVTLSRLAAAPDAKWDAAYQLDPEYIAVRDITINAGVHIPYDIYGDKVYCDAGTNDTVVADVIVHTDPTNWPPYFQRLVVLRLARLLASGMAERADLAKLLSDEANIQYKIAKNKDSQGQSTRRVRPSRITRGRASRMGL